MKKGKKLYDKREAIKERDNKRNIDRIKNIVKNNLFIHPMQKC